MKKVSFCFTSIATQNLRALPGQLAMFGLIFGWYNYVYACTCGVVPSVLLQTPRNWQPLHYNASREWSALCQSRNVEKSGLKVTLMPVWELWPAPEMLNLFIADAKLVITLLLFSKSRFPNRRVSILDMPRSRLFPCQSERRWLSESPIRLNSTSW